MGEHINPNLTQAISKKIRHLREQRNYSQEHMSMKLNISQNAYSRLERGLTKLDVDRLNEISAVLDVDISVFFVHQTKSEVEVGNPASRN